jgi:hypothetical protein
VGRGRSSQAGADALAWRSMDKLCGAELKNGMSCRNKAGKKGRCWMHRTRAKSKWLAAGAAAGGMVAHKLIDVGIDQIVRHFTGAVRGAAPKMRRASPPLASVKRSAAVRSQIHRGPSARRR